MAGAPTGINPIAAAGLNQPTGLEALLAHPYFQAAAAGLFGMLASPRQRGLSGALGIGGLGALNAFQEAERNKLQLPLLAAQIQGQQAQTQSNLATGGLHRAQTAALQGQLQGDAESAHHMDILASDPSTPPAARQIYATLSPSVRSGKIGADKVFAAAQTGDLKAAQLLLDQTRTALAGEQLKELPGLTAAKEQADIARAGEAGAGAALSRAKMGEVAPTIEHLKAETERVRKGPAAKPADPTAEIGKGLTNVAKLQQEYAKSRGLTGKISDYVTGLGAGYNQYAIGKGLNPTTGKALEPLPSGYKYTGDATKDGAPIVQAPDGSLHKALSD